MNNLQYEIDLHRIISQYYNKSISKIWEVANTCFKQQKVQKTVTINMW